MTRDEYIAAVAVIVAHDKIIRRVRDVSEDLAREVGDDFGGAAIVAETPLRDAFIKMIETVCGDTSSNTSYLIEEAFRMKDGGFVELKTGERFPITNPADCWDAIQAINRIETQ